MYQNFDLKRYIKKVSKNISKKMYQNFHLEINISKFSSKNNCI